MCILATGLCVAQGGIELKEAAANPLLGQYHLQNGGHFVKAKLPSADEAYRSSKPPGPGAGAKGPGSSSRGSTPRHADGSDMSLDDDISS
jgi:hypothetical protein